MKVLGLFIRSLVASALVAGCATKPAAPAPTVDKAAASVARVQGESKQVVTVIREVARTGAAPGDKRIAEVSASMIRMESELDGVQSELSAQGKKILALVAERDALTAKLASAEGTISFLRAELKRERIRTWTPWVIAGASVVLALAAMWFAGKRVLV